MNGDDVFSFIHQPVKQKGIGEFFADAFLHLLH